MGRRLNTSTTTVIQTELRPLTDNFELIPNGQTEQWYHVNTNVFAPDRQLKPLVIAPKVSALDEETSITYAPILDTTEWYAMEWNGTDYVETRITNHEEGFQYDYIITDAGLKVNKNISDASHGVQIRCVGNYIDPRDAGIAYEVQQTIKLTTNRDAEVVYPKIDVLAPSTQMYNPLVDASSQFSLKAKADWTGVPKSSEFIVDYAVDPKGTEAIIPDNESALVTSAPTMDIRYGKGSGSVLKEDQQFMYRQVSDGTVSPIGSNLAYVEKIKGNTVKWNQVFTPYNGSVTANGITISGDGSGKITIIANSPSGFHQVVKVVKNIISGHKYLCCGWDYSTLKMEVYNNTFFPSSSGSDYWILTAQQSGNCTMNIYAPASLPNGTYYIYPQLFDLTIIYGAGNEPTTDAAFKSWLSRNIGLKSYYPYNAGELIPVKMSAIKSVGFNLFKGNSTGNSQYIGDFYIGPANTNYAKSSNGNFNCFRLKVFSSKKYYMTSNSDSNLFSAAIIRFVDINYRLISGDNSGYSSKGIAFTTPSNCAYIEFSIGKTETREFIVNRTDASRNGTYEAHWEAEQYLPITELKGKVNGQGDSVVIFPDGMKRLSDTLYDEIKVEDGVVKAIRKTIAINLGALDWSLSGTFTATVTSGVKFVGTYSDVSNILCAKYKEGSKQDLDNGVANIAGRGNQVIVKDSNYGTAEAFKTAMDGVLLYCELETPLTYIIDNMPRGQFEWYGVKNGTEVKIDTLPCYVSGQHTDTVVVDAMYDENMSVILRLKETAASASPMPMKVYKNIVWRIPPLSSHVMSKNGGAVRSNSGDFKFTTIVNSMKTLISEEVAREHLRFNWRMHRTNTAEYTNKGWGYNMVAIKQELINVRGQSGSLSSTHVDNDVYLLGAYEAVTYDNEELTYNGTRLFGRSLG